MGERNQAMTKGYGHDFSGFDALTKPLLDKATEKFGKHAYRNWCPFKSPAGAWMAFHMSSYSDIRVINLDTMEVVVDGEFYAHLHRGDDGKVDWRAKETVYASHTNTSVYVPSYAELPYTNHKGEADTYVVEGHEFEPEDSDKESRVTLDFIRSVPLAFNAWTIWAADYEFYVDVLDLSDVDNGNISILELGEKHRGMSIPISASHVRNFIKPSIDHWIKIGDKSKGEENSRVKDVTFDAMILTESHLGRLELGAGERGFHDIYTEDKTAAYPRGRKPWESLRDRLNERKAAAE